MGFYFIEDEKVQGRVDGLNKRSGGLLR